MITPEMIEAMQSAYDQAVMDGSADPMRLAAMALLKPAMPEEISGLIGESLNCERNVLVCPVAMWGSKAKTALTATLALHKPAMPGEIEKLLERIDLALHPSTVDIVKRHTLSECAAALSSLAMEVERLKNDSRYQMWEEQSGRIRELEAALAAVRNKTIEECARVMEATQTIPGQWRRTAAHVIRALATGETK